MKRLIVLSLALAAAFAASAEEMYYNRLSKGDRIVPAGTYGAIVVPEGGYKATQFPSALGTISEAAGDFGGSYAPIIGLFGKNVDLADHTVSGWFKVPTKTSGDTTLCVEKTPATSTTKNHRGNAIKVSAEGRLVVGKINSSDTWQDDASHITSTDTVPTNEWFYLTVSFTVNHGSTAATRTATAKAYVNGVAIALPETKFQCNYNASTAECAALKVGDNVECAGLRVDDAAVSDTAAMKAWAVNPKYVVSTLAEDIVSAHWTGLAGDGDALNPDNWACTNLAGHVVEGGVPTNTAASVFIREPLSMNLDWTALGAVKFGEGMIDLNGQRLAVASLAETEASVLITNAVEGAGDIMITTGTTKLLTNLVFRAGTTVTVGGGATLDENGVIDMPLGVRLENGAMLTNTGTARGYSSAQFMGGLQVADGATAYIDTPNQFAFTGTKYATMPIDIGSGTLVKRGKGKISFQNAAIVGTGTIRLEEGEINLGNKGLSIADDITVEIRDNAGTDTYLWIEVTCAIPRLAGDGRIAASKASLTVTKYFSGRLKLGQKGGGNQFNNGTLTFGDTMTLDLAGVNGLWTQHKKMVYAPNATVFADLADRTIAEGDKIIAWSALPPATSRILAKGADVYFVRRADGLYASRTAMIFVR